MNSHAMQGEEIIRPMIMDVKGWHTTHNCQTTAIDKWAGFKFVMYNLPQLKNGTTFVKMENWINENADVTSWKKFDEKIDNGGWGTESILHGFTRPNYNLGKAYRGIWMGQCKGRRHKKFQCQRGPEYSMTI